jgi:hypothetical protein
MAHGSLLQIRSRIPELKMLSFERPGFPTVYLMENDFLELSVVHAVLWVPTRGGECLL